MQISILKQSDFSIPTRFNPDYLNIISILKQSDFSTNPYVADLQTLLISILKQSDFSEVIGNINYSECRFQS